MNDKDANRAAIRRDFEREQYELADQQPPATITPDKAASNMHTLMETQHGKIMLIPRAYAAALLVGYEANRPRVLTLREVQCYNDFPVLWVEKTGGIPSHWMDTNGIINYFAHPDSEHSASYGITWRCWTREPTPEQSNSIPWKRGSEPGGEW